MASSLPMTLRLYRRLSNAAVPLAPALIKRRLKQGKEDPKRVGERRGFSEDVRPGGPLVWIHGASVGEVLAAAALIERLRALNLRILLTSGTVTSASIVAKRFPADIIHQYVPYDSPRYVARFLDHWRPSLALFIESDLWPNIILASAARRLPMVLINGRMSHRSFPRWRKINATISALLGRFDICLAQSQVDAERFAALGSRNVITTGNLKLDVPAPPADPQRLQRLTAATRGRPVIVAASTHPGEDEILVETHRTLVRYFPQLLSVIVPRHPDRGETIARGIAAAGLTPGLRSREEVPSADTDIYVANTMGELGLFYRLAPIVFMGGSLVRHGGQNPIEAIKLGAAIVHGPHVFNFTELYDRLDHAGGARQADGQEALVEQLGQLLSDAAAREQTSLASARVVDQLGGALDRTMTALEPYLLQLRIEMGAGVREPAFWYRPPSLLSRLLTPLGLIYGQVTARRMARRGVDAGVPVMCVGNYHTGGAGKTPTVLALAKLLRELGETPVVLSRGYGGQHKGPLKVDPDHHQSADVGDEPLMMADKVTVVIARDRVGGAALARSQGASVILMDDGFQNPAIAKDISIIVVDAHRGVGNGRVFPAGPLRAPLPPQFARTDALVVIGEGDAASAVAAEIAARGGSVLPARLAPDAASLALLGGKRVLAFAGIGDPGRFFRTLRSAGVDVVSERVFADHHPYSQNEIKALIAEARRDGLTPVTTQKDLVRLRGGDVQVANEIAAFAVALEFDDATKLRSFVRDRLSRARDRS